jgi:hypothetical protein
MGEYGRGASADDVRGGRNIVLCSFREELSSSPMTRWVRQDPYPQVSSPRTPQTPLPAVEPFPYPDNLGPLAWFGESLLNQEVSLKW